MEALNQFYNHNLNSTAAFCFSEKKNPTKKVEKYCEILYRPQIALFGLHFFFRSEFWQRKRLQQNSWRIPKEFQSHLVSSVRTISKIRQSSMALAKNPSAPVENLKEFLGKSDRHFYMTSPIVVATSPSRWIIATDMSVWILRSSKRWRWRTSYFVSIATGLSK